MNKLVSMYKQLISHIIFCYTYTLSIFYSQCIRIIIMNINDMSGCSEKKNAQDDQTKADPQYEPCNPNAVHVVVVLKECRIHLLKLA